MNKVEYDNLLFRGMCILRKKEEAFRNQLIASSFSAWQILSAKGLTKDNWKAYLTRLQLIEKEEIQEGQLKQDFNQAMLNVEKIKQRFSRNKKV